MSHMFLALTIGHTIKIQLLALLSVGLILRLVMATFVFILGQ